MFNSDKNIHSQRADDLVKAHYEKTNRSIARSNSRVATVLIVISTVIFITLLAIGLFW